VATLVFSGGAFVTSAAEDDVILFPKVIGDPDEDSAPPSGVIDFRDVDVGNALTECPQAGSTSNQPKPLDQRAKDKVEQLANGGNDIKTNQDYSCFPQDETSIAINPTNPKNAVGGANDYRLGWGSSGFYATTDGGNHWYDGVKPFPTNANSPRDHIDGGGDPSIAFDRDGVVYYNDLHFMRENDESGIFVARSTNGGFTWSRPCVPAGTTDAGAFCGGNGDVRRPGDGVVQHNADNDNALNGSVPANDKNYMTTGPRPAGVAPTCFAPISKTPIAAGAPGCPTSIIGVDRLVVPPESHQRERSVLFVWCGEQLRLESVLCPHRQPDDRRALGRVREFQHERREPVPRRPVPGRRDDIPGTLLRQHRLRRQLPTLGFKPNGLHRPRTRRTQRPHKQLLPRQRRRKHRRRQARRRIRR